MRGITEPFEVGLVPLAMIREADGVIYVSGHIPLDEKGYFVQGDVGVQTEQVLSNIKQLLESIGSSMDQVVKTSVYLAHAKRDFDRMNEAYQKFFSSEQKPARTTVGVELAVDVLVEIEAIAVRDAAARSQ